MAFPCHVAANLAHLQYFDQHWNSAKPGGNQSLHPDEFSLPLQFATGYAAVKYGLPEGVGRVRLVVESMHAAGACLAAGLTVRRWCR